MNAIRTHDPVPPPVSRWAMGSAVLGNCVIGAGAFWLSALSLTMLATMAGIPESFAWMWPVIVDGMILVATVSVVALSAHGPGATTYAWSLLIGGTTVSVVANATHSFLIPTPSLPSISAALIGAVPPLALLATTHLTVQLTRRTPHPTASHHTVSSHAASSPAASPPTDKTVQSGTTEHPHRSPAALSPTRVEPPLIRETISSPHTVSAELIPVHITTRTPTTPATAPASASASAETTAPPRKIPSTPRTAQVRRDEALRLAGTGISNTQIAEKLNVHKSTIGRWLADHPTPAPPPHTPDHTEASPEIPQHTEQGQLS